MQVFISTRSSDLENFCLDHKLEFFLYPCLEFTHPSSFDKLDLAIRQNHIYDWIIFVSTRAAEAFFTRLLELGGYFFNLSPHIKIGAIGQTTANFIREDIGFPVDFVPKDFNSEAFSQEFVDQFIHSPIRPKILIIRNEIGREDSFAFLENFADCDKVAAYSSKIPNLNSDLQARLLEILDYPVILSFGSSQTVRNFSILSNFLPLEKYPQLKIISIGPPCTQTILEIYGEDIKDKIIQADNSSLDAVKDALKKILSRQSLVS